MKNYLNYSKVTNKVVLMIEINPYQVVLYQPALREERSFQTVELAASQKGRETTKYKDGNTFWRYYKPKVEETLGLIQTKIHSDWKASLEDDKLAIRDSEKNLVDLLYTHDNYSEEGKENKQLASAAINYFKRTNELKRWLKMDESVKLNTYPTGISSFWEDIPTQEYMKVATTGKKPSYMK